MNRMLYARKMTSTEKFNMHVSDVNHSPTMDGQGVWQINAGNIESLLRMLTVSSHKMDVLLEIK